MDPILKPKLKQMFFLKKIAGGKGIELGLTIVNH
jgi:hypothetical protein